MRIGIDISPALKGKRYGVPYYVLSLVTTLLAGESKDMQFVLTADQSAQEAAKHLQTQGVRVPEGQAELVSAYRVPPRRHPLPNENRLLYRARTLSQRIGHRVNESLDDRVRRLGPVDVFHHTDYVAGRWTGLSCPHVATVHDLIPVKFPELCAPQWARFAERGYPFARDCAAAIVTYSESSRNDIVEYLKVDPDRVHVIPLAVRPGLRVTDTAAARAAEDAVRARYGIEARPFILAVGRLDPMKNLSALLRAFSLLLREPGSPLGDARLVLAGPVSQASRRDGAAEVEAQLTELGIRDRCILTGFVSDDELSALMRACACFVFPSLYEGFGLPPLEAMACGAPVVASSASSIPEVTGDRAALLVDPHDVEAMADAIGRVLTDGDLATRLRAAGIERAAQFSWQKVADAHRRVYRSVAAAGAGAH